MEDHQSSWNLVTITNSRSLRSVFPLFHLPWPSSRSSAITDDSLSTVIAKPNGYGGEFVAEEVGDMFLAAKDLRWGLKEVEQGSFLGRKRTLCGVEIWKRALRVAGLPFPTVSVWHNPVEGSSSGGSGDERDIGALAVVAHMWQRSNLVIPLSRDLLLWWCLRRNDFPMMM
ncbi:hypothetical protein V8G54_007764 [Vigna mungo]|uniref:Uncharacterized protein n=1 Tax=Vigna mungo TaxID=3915 RepID=A0AAQ3P4C4_VIGMU